MPRRQRVFGQAFLRHRPFDSRYWWSRAIQRPYEAGSAAGASRQVIRSRRVMQNNGHDRVFLHYKQHVGLHEHRHASAGQLPRMLRLLAARSRLLAVLKPALGGIMWRSAKRDVAAELGVPAQRHSLASLRLSAIERHFYQRQHQARSNARIAHHVMGLSKPGADQHDVCRRQETCSLNTSRSCGMLLVLQTNSIQHGINAALSRIGKHY